MTLIEWKAFVDQRKAEAIVKIVGSVGQAYDDRSVQRRGRGLAPRHLAQVLPAEEARSGDEN